MRRTFARRPGRLQGATRGHVETSPFRSRDLGKWPLLNNGRGSSEMEFEIFDNPLCCRSGIVPSKAGRPDLQDRVLGKGYDGQGGASGEPPRRQLAVFVIDLSR